MKKIILFVGLCLSAMAVFAQVEHKESRYPNGNLRYEGDFKDGKPVGELRRYHENGQLSGIQTFDNEGNSTIVCYTGTGELLAEGSYKAHNRDGLWKFYGEGEYLFMVENYQDGLRIGESLIFSKEGKLLQRMNYKNGKLDGERIHYYPYGNIMAKYTYVDGVLEGPYTYFFETGHINEEGTYLQGKANGIWRSYEEDGTFVEAEYINGELANPEAYNQSIQNKLDKYDVDPKIKDPEDFMNDPNTYFSL
jgi:antitoxin component YwqK of YwqJK toxin-antitoxin module